MPRVSGATAHGLTNTSPRDYLLAQTVGASDASADQGDGVLMVLK